MVIANILNWTVGGVFMRSMGVMTRIPKQYLLPVVLLLTFASLYVQNTEIAVIGFATFFGALGYLMIKLGISPLPFVIAFVLGRQLEDTARQAFSATGGDPFFLFTSPIALAFMVASVTVIVVMLRRGRRL